MSGLEAALAAHGQIRAPISGMWSCACGADAGEGSA